MGELESVGTGPRRVAKARRPKLDDLVGLRDAVARLAWRLRGSCSSLRLHEQEDLVQEVMLHAAERIDRFEGRSSFKTWVIALARNRLLSMARAARLRPKPEVDSILDRPNREDPVRDANVREARVRLRAWLATDEGRREVPHGRVVFDLLLAARGDWKFVALAMGTCVPLREGWTEERVRGVARLIRGSAAGQALARTIGLGEEETA